jgi:hypothetical protein
MLNGPVQDQVPRAFQQVHFEIQNLGGDHAFPFLVFTTGDTARQTRKQKFLMGHG